MRRPKKIQLTQQDRAVLERWSKDPNLPAKQRLRADVLLLADKGEADTAIANALGISRQRSGRTRARFLAEGVQAIAKDRPRPGRPTRIDAQRIVTLTNNLHATTAWLWSRRKMAKESGVSPSTVGRIWERERIKPQLAPPKVSHVPHFAERLEAIVGLYLAPPIRALVLCQGKTSNIDAVKRVPLPQERRRSTNLSAALMTLSEIFRSTGQVWDDHGELVRFLQQVDTHLPADHSLYVFVASDAKPGRSLAEAAWPQGESQCDVIINVVKIGWLIAVHRLFRTLSKLPLRQGMFQSMGQLHRAITQYIAAPQAARNPFSWTAKLSDIRAMSTHGKLQE